MIARVAAAQGAHVERPLRQTKPDRRVRRLIQVQIIQVEEATLLGPVGGPESGENLVVVYRVKSAGIRHHRLHAEEIDIKLLAVPEELAALERAARVGPI